MTLSPKTKGRTTKIFTTSLHDVESKQSEEEEEE